MADAAGSERRDQRLDPQDDLVAMDGAVGSEEGGVRDLAEVDATVPVGDGATAPDQAAAADLAPTPCPCASGLNCIAGRCQPPLADCADVLTRQLGDGEYWVGGVSPHLAYCDGQTGGELCSTVEGQHEGRSRDPAHIPFLMTSVLANGECRIWAVRHRDDGYPLAGLAKKGAQQLSVCQALGFVGDGDIGSCLFGWLVGDCGFSTKKKNRWGNKCIAICNPTPEKYTLQGEFAGTEILSSTDGETSTRCYTR